MSNIIWLILIALFLIVEIITLGITTVWFACGALVAFLISLVYNNIILELSVFLIVSGLMLFFTRPIILKYFNPKREKTNYERVIGLEGIVLSTIDNMNFKGKVMVNNQEWSARSNDNQIIEEGKKVIIKEISGVKLIVEILKEDV